MLAEFLKKVHVGVTQNRDFDWGLPPLPWACLLGVQQLLACSAEPWHASGTNLALARSMPALMACMLL